jgi:acyl carrier protein
MSEEPTLERVQAIVARVAGQNPSLAADADTLLTDGGYWLDSVHLLETIIACEEAFAVEFDADVDLTATTLMSVRTLFDLIRSKRAG